MTFEPTRTYRLVDKDQAGLACDAQGVALGGIPLAWVCDGDDGAPKWQTRSRGEVADILKAAYGAQPPAVIDRCHRGLRRIAAQFEAGDVALAGIEALMLRLPPIEPDRMAKLALSEFVRDGDAWQNEPRVPAGGPGGGQWTTGGGTSPAGPAPPSPESARERSRPEHAVEPAGVGSALGGGDANEITVTSTLRPTRRQNANGFYPYNSGHGGVFYIPTLAGGQPVQSTEVRALDATAFQVGWSGDGTIELRDAKGRVYRTGTTPSELQNFNATTGRELGVAIYTHPDIPLGSPDVPTAAEQRRHDEEQAAQDEGTQASLDSPSGRLTTFVGENLVTLPFLALAPLAAEADAGLELNTAEGSWPTKEPVAVVGGRAIDSASSYETAVRDTYPAVSQRARRFEVTIDGKLLKGKADTVAQILDKNTAVEAKYVRNWSKSILNPGSKVGAKSFASKVRDSILLQARKYSEAFEGGAVYYTNSPEFASYYYKVFRTAGIDNIRFVITGATMAKSIEHILGPIAQELPLPGTQPGRADKTRYVSFDRSKRPDKLFSTVVERISPPLVKEGGAILDNFILTTPDGTAFYPITYHKDPEWPRQIELGAAELGFVTAKIGEGASFVICDGRVFAIADCKVEQIPLTPPRRRPGGGARRGLGRAKR